MPFLFLIILFISLSQCDDKVCVNQCETFHFDDIQLASLYGNISLPYRDYLFERDDMSWTVRAVGIVNTSFQERLGPFSAAAHSLPNVILLSTDTMAIRRRDGRQFDAIDFYVRSIVMDLHIRIRWSERDSLLLLIEKGVTKHITLNQQSIKYLSIGSEVVDLDTYSLVVIDDIRLCH